MSLLDDKESTGGDLEALLESQGKSFLDEEDDDPMSMENIDKEWDLLHFGRAPDPYYLDPLEDRYTSLADCSLPVARFSAYYLCALLTSTIGRYLWNITRAEQLFEDMAKNNVAPDLITMNSYLSVLTEAMKVDSNLVLCLLYFYSFADSIDSVQAEGAYQLVDSFSSYGLQPDSRTYQHLVRMHVRSKDINGALKVRGGLFENQIISLRETEAILLVESGIR